MITQISLEVATPGRGALDVTARIRAEVAKSGVVTGLCQVFIRHTSASLMVCENADPAVLRDMETFMRRLVPDGDPMFEHIAEGPDDMPAHVRSVLTQTSISLPISDAALALGTWQAVYLWEHRHAAHRRRLMITIVGD